LRRYTVDHNIGGLRLTTSAFHTIKDNVITSNSFRAGIALSGSSNNTVKDNTIGGGGQFDGITLSSSAFNTIKDNTVSNNLFTGIQLSSASHNVT